MKFHGDTAIEYWGEGIVGKGKEKLEKEIEKNSKGEITEIRYSYAQENRTITIVCTYKEKDYTVEIYVGKDYEDSESGMGNITIPDYNEIQNPGEDQVEDIFLLTRKESDYEYEATLEFTSIYYNPDITLENYKEMYFVTTFNKMLEEWGVDNYINDMEEYIAWELVGEPSKEKLRDEIKTFAVIVTARGFRRRSNI